MKKLSRKRKTLNYVSPENGVRINPMRKNKDCKFAFYQICQILLIIMMLVGFSSCQEKQEEIVPDETEPEQGEVVPDQPVEEDVDDDMEEDDPEEEEIDPGVPYDPIKNLDLYVLDEGQIISYSSEDYYRYGPSIMKYEDGSMDAWFSAPGNSGSQWDWITYRHSDDGINWGSEQTVMRPTPGSRDQCSVCDPGLIYFDGYYYMGYTGTDYYEGKGSCNSAFVARSKYPDGPFEKWNGEGWGGYPEPIIEYKGDPAGWGIGEVSFVIKDDDLFIYFSYYDINGGYIGLSKADLVEDWPSTIRFKNEVLQREHQDSLDVVYDEKNDTFFGFSINQRMSERSRLIMYYSGNGKNFEKVDSIKDHIEDFAHNMGISKGLDGHVNTDEDLLIGYAYGENWGRWNAKFQYIQIR